MGKYRKKEKKNSKSVSLKFCLFFLEDEGLSTLKCRRGLGMNFYDILYSLCNAQYKQHSSKRSLQKRTFEKGLNTIQFDLKASTYFKVKHTQKVNSDSVNILKGLSSDNRHIWLCHRENEGLAFECVNTLNEGRNRLKEKEYFPLEKGLEVISKWIIESM